MPISAAVHSGLSVEITNQLASVVFSCYSGGNIVIVIVFVVILIIVTVVGWLDGGGG